jgi:hypothetical protein
MLDLAARREPEFDSQMISKSLRLRYKPILETKNPVHRNKQVTRSLTGQYGH